MTSKYLLIILPSLGLILLACIGLVLQKANREKKKNEIRVSELHEANRIISHVEAEYNACSRKYASGTPTIDVFLAKAEKRCTENSIDISIVMGGFPKELADGTNQVKMTRLVANLVDNAIEAAAQCDEKWIKIKSINGRGLWTLSVENSKSEELDPLGNGMKTTKRDREYHGIGTRSSDRIVKDAGGAIRRIDKGTAFQVIAIIPYRR